MNGLESGDEVMISTVCIVKSWKLQKYLPIICFEFLGKSTGLI